MKKVTMEDAPNCLNTNDKAMWVLGWNDCLEAAPALDAQKVRDEAFEHVAYFIENGNFIHDSAPDAIIAKQAAKAIRKLKSSPAQPVATQPTQDRMQAEINRLRNVIHSVCDDVNKSQGIDSLKLRQTIYAVEQPAPTTLEAQQDHAEDKLDMVDGEREKFEAAIKSFYDKNYELTPILTRDCDDYLIRTISIAYNLYRAALQSQPASKGDAKPFMYAIQEPNGEPYFDELCVSGLDGDLDETVDSLNEDSPDGGYKAVPVYLHPESPSKPQLLELVKNLRELVDLTDWQYAVVNQAANAISKLSGCADGKPKLSDEAEEATDEMIDAACDAVPDLYRVDAMRAIEAALLVRQSSERDTYPFSFEVKGVDLWLKFKGGMINLNGYAEYRRGIVGENLLKAIGAAIAANATQRGDA